METDPKLTFDELKNHAQDIIKYSDSRVMMIDGLHSFEEMRIHSEAYIIVLCTNGSAQLKMEEGQEIEVVPNDIVLSHPDQFFEHVRTSLDFRCSGVLFSPEYFEQLLLVACDKYYGRKMIETNPIIHLTDEEREELCHDFDYVKFKMNSQLLGEHRNAMMDNLFQALIFGSADVLMHRLKATVGEPKFTSGESLTSRFLELVEHETPRMREVGAYADRLCVTPKYLSSVCRRETGMTARDIINQKVQKKIRRMLTNPDMTVKQVAEACGFDNLSFFGKYVKREMGASPRELRQRIA